MLYTYLRQIGRQKLKNSIKSDLLDKCPKCGDYVCDCIIKQDEIEPMLVMHKPDPKDGNSVPFYIPLSRVPTVHKFDLEKIQIQIQKPLTMNIDKLRNASREDVIKNDVQNGTILEEDRPQNEDTPEVQQETAQNSVSSRQSVEYTSHLEVNLEKKPGVKCKDEETVERPMNESSV